MKRLIRILALLIAGTSFLLCLAIILLWIRSYFISDKLHWSRRPDDQPDEGRMGWFDAWTIRGRLGMLIETNSAYLDDWPRDLRHETESLEFAQPAEIEGPFGHGGLFAGPNGELPLYHIYFDHFGLAYYRNDINGTGHNHNFIIPFWIPAAFTGAFPMVLIARKVRSVYRRRWRREQGRCASCGYDLRASRERCPECGLAISTPNPPPQNA